MAEVEREQQHDVPGLVVLAHVGLDGLLWGPAGGAAFAVLFLLGVGAIGAADGESALWALAGAPAAVVLGGLAGLVVGAVLGPVAALLLLASRPFTAHAPSFATAATLLVLALLAPVLLSGFTGATVLGAPLVCLVAAWPLHRALTRALRPVGQPA